MKTAFRIPLTILAAALAAVPAFAGDWTRSFEEGMATAKAKGKLAILFFHADWCSYSQKMRSGTLRNAAVARALQSVVPISLNIDREGAKYKERFGIKMYPSFVFVEPSGAKFGEISGYFGPTIFRDEVAKFATAFRDQDDLLRQYKSSPGSGEVNARLAWLYGIKRKEAEALKHLGFAKKAGYNGPHLAKAENMVGDIYQLSGRYDAAIVHFEAAASASDLGDRSYALVSLMCCQFASGDRTGATRTARQLIGLKGATAEYVSFAKEELKKRGISY